MKILVLSQYFWPESFRVNDLVENLVGRGHEVEVLTGQPNYPIGKLFDGYSGLPEKEKFKGAQVYRVPMFPRMKGRGWQLILNYFSFCFAASFFGTIWCRKKYDAIFVFQPSPITVGVPAMVIKWLTGAPIHFWVQDLWPESLEATGAVKSEKILRFVGFFVRHIYRYCDVVYIQSERFQAPVQKLGVPESKIKYFPNWAETFYKPIKSEKEIEDLAKGFRVLFAGNIGAAQSFETIVETADILKSYSDIQWIVFGDGRRKAWLEQEVKKRKLSANFHLMGSREPDSMPHYFSYADVLLVTLKKNPAFSMVIPSKVQSYLACGRPVIGSLEGEGARVIQVSGAGEACPPEDSKALAKLILNIGKKWQEIL
jgi:colanic acid biosynthesis glycosyl transferase WcaI